MKSISTLVIFLGFSGFLMAQSQIRVMNPDTESIDQAVIEIPWKLVLQAFPQVDTSRLVVFAAKDLRQLPFQFERLGESKVQNLLVQLSIQARGAVLLKLSNGKPATAEPKVYCRHVPERFDDFAWENDLVAFRIYGSSLKGRPDNAFGTDFWAKRTRDLVINKWYELNDYHTDHGEGLDYYHVGLTLGAGDIGVFLNDSLQFIHNYRHWRILDNGPLRTRFQVSFDPYTFNGILVNESRTVSLDAGSQLSKVQVQIRHSAQSDLPVVVGIVLRAEESSLMFDAPSGVMSYWEPAHGQDGSTGIGCVFPYEPARMLRKYEHALAQFSIASGAELVYFTGGAWDKAGRITGSSDWFTYLRRFARQQTRCPVIALEK